MGQAALVAQRPANAPATAPAVKPPDSVFIEDLTWAEVRDLVAAGTTTVIIGTAGTEQKGPHMVDGEHKFVMEYAADKIARALGKTLVAPVITYVPEGSWENPGGHMGKPGTITLPEDRFVELLVSAGRSLKSGGFKTILFLGESGGNRTGMRTAATRLNELFGDSAKAFWIDDYYTKSHDDQNEYVTDHLKIPADQIGGHANILDTSEMLFVNPKHVRKDKLAPGGGYQNSGVSGDPTKSTAALGKIFIQIKVDNARRADQRTDRRHDSAAPSRPQRAAAAARGGGRQGGGRAAAEAAAVRPASAAQAARQPGATGTAPADDGDGAGGDLAERSAPDTVFIDELTWEETRDALKAGKTTAIIPTGGTEKNGYHMVLGKHNYIVTHSANLMARRLKNALVAPTIQYVPEGNPDRAGPGHHLAARRPPTISCSTPPRAASRRTASRTSSSSATAAAIRRGMRARRRGAEQGVDGHRVQGRSRSPTTTKGPRALSRLAAKPRSATTIRSIGSHAGISDTSQLLHVRPAGVRKDQIKPWGGPQDSGVSGDPMKATAEIGRMGIEFKINAALAQLSDAEEPATSRGWRRKVGRFREDKCAATDVRGRDASSRWRPCRFSQRPRRHLRHHRQSRARAEHDT